MPTRFVPLLVLAFGCQTSRLDVPASVEHHVAAAADVRATLEVVPVAAISAAPERLDLPGLWSLALAHNPNLREASADIEMARGRLIQAQSYPNPRFVFGQDTLGSNIAPQGNLSFQINQEFVTAGKRRLDQAIAGREISAATIALIGKKFDTLTRVRRAYYDYLCLRQAVDLNGETVTALERGLEVTRQQVEKAKTRPKTDLLRLEALLEEARINQGRAKDLADGAWRQLAAEIGLPDLAAPTAGVPLPEIASELDQEVVKRRILASHTAIRQANIEVERAKVAIERARAGAKPNVLVGAGYNADNTDQTAGAIITVETAIPVWNRQQGVIHEAQAKLASSSATVKSTENRLIHDAADAYARHKAASRQVTRLNSEVLPRLQESLELLRKAYQAGSAQVTFSDVLMTEQNINTTRLTLAEARRALWQSFADLQGVMQLDIDETLVAPPRP